MKSSTWLVTCCPNSLENLTYHIPTTYQPHLTVHLVHSLPHYLIAKVWFIPKVHTPCTDSQFSFFLRRYEHEVWSKLARWSLLAGLKLWPSPFSASPHPIPTMYLVVGPQVTHTQFLLVVWHIHLQQRLFMLWQWQWQYFICARNN